ncbi:MAG: hypothetical protein ACI8SE_000716 [Bacteroidia bacterium]|jgi:hypothetical protein
MKLSLIIVATFLFAGCQPTSTDQGNHKVVTPTMNQDAVNQDSGIVLAMEDIGYPLFALDLKQSGSDKTKSYLLNIEEINITHDAAYKLKGKKIELQYSRTDEAFVMDIEHQNQSLLGEWAPENHVGCNSIIGILSGAEEASQGDLPGSFTVTTNDPSTHMTFEYYIDDALAKVNGDTVEVYYEFREVFKVLGITFTH